MALTEYNPDLQIGYGSNRVVLADPETGELVELVEKTKLSYGEQRYKKTFPAFFQMCYEYSDSAKTKVLFYVLKSLKYKQYRYVGTCEEIAKQIGVSRAAVYEAVKEMERCDIIRRKIPSVWFINPNLLSDVDELYQRKLSEEYYSIPRKERSFGNGIHKNAEKNKVLDETSGDSVLPV